MFKNWPRTLLLIFLTGLLLRLLLMPFAMQADLLSLTYRAHLMSEYGLWGYDPGQLLAHYLYAVNLWLIKPFFPDLASFFSTTHGSLTSTTSSVGDWLNFVAQPQINAFIFALKVPHLLADLGVFYLLAQFFAKSKHKSLILALWWFNPVNLYAFYIFARHDSLTLLALAGTLLWLARGKKFSGLLAFFAAVQIRFQPILYLPLILIHLWKHWTWQKLWRPWLACALVIVFLTGLSKFLPYNQELYAQVRALPEQVFQTSTNASFSIPDLLYKPFSLATSVGGRSTGPKLLIFTACFALLNLFYFLLRPATDSAGKLTQLSGILYLTLALYFAINDFSPHYFVWLSLFAVLSLSVHKAFVWAYLLAVLGWGIMGLTATGNFAITQNLFLPISPLLFNTPPLALVLPQAELIFTLGHWLLRLGLLWSAFLVSRSLASDLLPPKLWYKLWRAGSLSLLFLTLAVTPVQAAKIPMLTTDGTERVLLEVNRPVQASFVAPENHLGAIDLKFDTSRSSQAKKVAFRLKKSGDEAWFYEHSYDASDFYNRAFYPFGFPVVADSAGQIFIYEVELLDEADLPLHLYSESYQLSREGSLAELLQLIQLDLQAKWQAQRGFWIFWLGLLGANFLAIIAVLGQRKEKF